MDQQAVPLEAIRARRFAFLSALYDAAEGSSDSHVNMRKTARSIGLDDEPADKVVTYLAGEGLLSWAAMGMIRLTHEGVKEVEQAQSAPERPTPHFPPLVLAQTYINVGTMNQSQIQQGTTGSTQWFAAVDVDALRELVDDVRALELDPQHARDVEAELAKVEAQLDSPRPDRSVLREALSSTRTILEGAVGGGLANTAHHIPGLVERLAHVLSSLPL
jgi:hypothetical protein